MITALRLFYVIGGLIFYYYKVELEPKLAKKIYEEEDGIYPYRKDMIMVATSNKYKLFVLIACIIWPVALITNFISILVNMIAPRN